MNLFCKSFGFLLVTSFVLLSFAESYDRRDEKIKYVQGGACAPGKGTKQNPYISLEEAQLNSAKWDVLVVLSSTTPLNGGITLKDGQKLIGEENPTGIALSPTQPTITNTTTNNGGNGVLVESGDVTIENIYFTDIESSAISYDNAQDLTVKNVLITNSFGIGIYGICYNSGNTTIQNLIIRDTLGDGIHEELFQSGIHRDLSICNFNMKNVGSTGVRVIIDDSSNSSFVVIRDSSFEVSPGVRFINTGQQSAVIKDTSFHNTFLGIDCNSSGPSSFKLRVDGCLFENGIDAMRFLDSDSSSDIVVKNSVINSVIDSFSRAVRSTIFDTAPGSSTQKICLKDNRVTADIFYSVRNNSNNQSGQTNVDMQDNLFNGVTAVQIDANAPWNSFVLDAQHNCFVGDDTAAAFLSQNGPAGSAIIYAHKNSFSHFVPDIQDNSAGVFYEVTHNWWGHATPVVCTPGSCAFAQTCVNGLCQGPIVVGTTKVLASDPLTASITCPHSCCA